MVTNHERVLKGLKALDKAMHENQCYACSHEFIDAVNEFGTDIIHEAINILKDQQNVISILRLSREALFEIVEEQKQIVRCKDCKHGYIGIDSNYIRCMKPYVGNGAESHMPEWFCADGERK